MKYHITYHLYHPRYLSALSHAVMEASPHTELDAMVAKIKMKWQQKGYSIHIVEFVAKEGVLIGISDAHKREDQIQVFSFMLVEYGKEAQQLVLGRHLARRRDGKHELLGLLSNAFNQRHQQGLLRS